MEIQTISRARRLLLLYCSFFRITALVVGGGLAMLPVIEEIFVNKYKLLTREELLDMTALTQTVPGIIRSVEDYGVFVELSPNLAGLAEPWEGAAVGQTASVFIKSLIPERLKVKLIIIDVFSPSGPTHAPAYYCSAGHLDRWRYSPPGCSRIVETDFSLPPDE